MKFSTDIFFGLIIAMLIVLFTIQAKETKQLQTQIDELRVVVNQRFLPAMILDELNVRPYENN
jgi:hypothetical protein